MIPGISISFQGVVALRLFNSLTKQRTLLPFTTTYLNCIEPLQRLSYPYPISPSPPPFFFSTEHDAVSSSVLRAYLTLLDYLVGRVLMPTASAGTVMRGHDNRVGSIPGISMPPNHRFSTYRLSPPPSAVYSIRDLLPVITTTFRRSSSSYPRPDKERERVCTVTRGRRTIAGLSLHHRIDTFDRVRIGDRVSTRDGSANESQRGRMTIADETTRFRIRNGEKYSISL